MTLSPCSPHPIVVQASSPQLSVVPAPSEAAATNETRTVGASRGIRAGYVESGVEPNPAVFDQTPRSGVFPRAGWQNRPTSRPDRFARVGSRPHGHAVELRVINPADQSCVGTHPYDTEPGIADKLARALETFRTWRRTPLADRIEIVQRGVSVMLERRDRLAREVTEQMGKPLQQALAEVDTLRERAEHMLAIAADVLAPDQLPKPGHERRIEHVPLGVVLDLAAWNYPLIIAVNVVVPALVAGNIVLLKHSAKTPRCGAAFEDAFAGLGPGPLVTNLVLTHDAARRLIATPGVAHVAFTGSVAGGRQVYTQAAERLIDVGLELGGKDPAYVAADADLEVAVAGIVDGACYNAGQSCCGVERVYVHRSRYAEFVERARAQLAAYRLGDPLAPETTMGPLASRSALDLLEAQVSQAVSRGAQLVCGGQRLSDTAGNFFPPTLLTDVANDVDAMQVESFGPLLPVASVGDDEEALRRIDDTSLGLTASIWTGDPDRAERLARAIDAGTVYQNRCDVLDPALPWTGARHSGLGSTLSRYGYYALTRRKAINFRR
ncbi:MAG: aldehyde dehydrogenase family protein [Myxococcales bacterium FL481]|nr:MAG: aldehyde dehydrogenase family protein [Myxococcales bacterium FL481]